MTEFSVIVRYLDLSLFKFKDDQKKKKKKTNMVNRGRLEMVKAKPAFWFFCLAMSCLALSYPGSSLSCLVSRVLLWVFGVFFFRGGGWGGWLLLFLCLSFYSFVLELVLFSFVLLSNS